MLSLMMILIFRLKDDWCHEYAMDGENWMKTINVISLIGMGTGLVVQIASVYLYTIDAMKSKDGGSFSEYWMVR